MIEAKIKNSNGKDKLAKLMSAVTTPLNITKGAMI